MIMLFRVVVFVAALIPFAEMSYMAMMDQSGLDTGGFILRYSASWALNFLVFSLAIAPAIRITGFSILSSLQAMMGVFALLYASLHLLAWIVVDLNANWQVVIEQIIQSPSLLAGAAGYVLLFLMLTNSSHFIKELLGPIGDLIGKLIIPVVFLSMVHFFLVTSEDRTMPGIYAGVFLTLMGYKGKAKAIPRSVPGLLSRLFKK